LKAFKKKLSGEGEERVRETPKFQNSTKTFASFEYFPDQPEVPGIDFLSQLYVSSMDPNSQIQNGLDQSDVPPWDKIILQ